MFIFVPGQDQAIKVRIKYYISHVASLIHVLGTEICQIIFNILYAETQYDFNT